MVEQTGPLTYILYLYLHQKRPNIVQQIKNGLGLVGTRLGYVTYSALLIFFFFGGDYNPSQPTLRFAFEPD